MHYTVAVLTLAGMVAAEAAVTGHGCPGVISGNGGGESDNYCCVGGNQTLSNCPGWPICTGSRTIDPATVSLTCATTVPVTASDYDAQVSSASSKYLDKDGSITATGDSKASETGGSSSNAASGAAVSSTTSQSDSTATGGVKSDTGTNGAAMAAATLLAPVGGLMAYAALQ